MAAEDFYFTNETWTVHVTAGAAVHSSAYESATGNRTAWFGALDTGSVYVFGETVNPVGSPVAQARRYSTDLVLADDRWGQLDPAVYTVESIIAAAGAIIDPSTGNVWYASTFQRVSDSAYFLLTEFTSAGEFVSVRAPAAAFPRTGGAVIDPATRTIYMLVDPRITGTEQMKGLIAYSIPDGTTTYYANAFATAAVDLAFAEGRLWVIHLAETGTVSFKGYTPANLLTGTAADNETAALTRTVAFIDNASPAGPWGPVAAYTAAGDGASLLAAAKGNPNGSGVQHVIYRIDLGTGAVTVEYALPTGASWYDGTAPRDLWGSVPILGRPLLRQRQIRRAGQARQGGSRTLVGRQGRWR